MYGTHDLRRAWPGPCAGRRSGASASVGGLLALIGVAPFAIFMSEFQILRAAAADRAFVALALFLLGRRHRVRRRAAARDRGRPGATRSAEPRAAGRRRGGRRAGLRGAGAPPGARPVDAGPARQRAGSRRRPWSGAAHEPGARLARPQRRTRVRCGAVPQRRHRRSSATHVAGGGRGRRAHRRALRRARADEAIRILLPCWRRRRPGRCRSLSTDVRDDYPALTPDCPQAHWFEREIAEQWGVAPGGPSVAQADPVPPRRTGPAGTPGAARRRRRSCPA